MTTARMRGLSSGRQDVRGCARAGSQRTAGAAAGLFQEIGQFAGVIGRRSATAPVLQGFPGLPFSLKVKRAFPIQRSSSFWP